MRMILLFVPGRPVLEVDEHGSRIGLVEGIAMKSYTRGRSELSLHACAGEIHGVIAGSRRFGRLIECAAIAVPVAHAVARERHYQNVAEIHAACTVEVCLREAPDQGISIGVFRAILPAHSTGHRACLHHTEGACGAGEGVASGRSSHKRIHILGIVGFCFGHFGAGA